MLSYLLTVVVFILIFSVLVLIHELGHFAMAKKAGIKVEEFGFGLPPRLWGKKKGETIYSINWIPFGGFVRMYGEDSTNLKFLKSKRSFVAKSMRDRTLVIIAGVVMNFLLAWALLSFGFMAGMQPLLVPEDVLDEVKNGSIILDSGLEVLSVDEGSLAERVGFETGDELYAIDDEPFSVLNYSFFDSPEAAVVSVLREGEFVDLEITNSLLTATLDSESEEIAGFGLNLKDFTLFPSVKIYDLEENSAAYISGLRSGDTILSIDGEVIFNVEEFENAIRKGNNLALEVYRDGLDKVVNLQRADVNEVLISSVVPGNPAAEAGLQSGDIIVSVDGVEMDSSETLVDYVASNFKSNQSLNYLIERDGEPVFYDVLPDENGKIGVYLSELRNYDGEAGMSVYGSEQLMTIEEIKEEQYPFYIAPIKAFSESVRISKLTALMFVDFVQGLVSAGEVPDSVAGPVGIAQMTHSFVQEGFVPLMRFTAVLSLSLAVINILPFPALDGGRLLFIVIELVLGRRVPHAWEARVHGLGYLLILFMILAVTYTDILRILA